MKAQAFRTAAPARDPAGFFLKVRNIHAFALTNRAFAAKLTKYSFVFFPSARPASRGCCPSGGQGSGTHIQKG